ncbi:DUF6325 family protein [Cellulomonas sp. McL0617]|uniref:DUF6325 family protein n=1 Tax=Cellulomonas sp. McL0617 TaxID=3415675 RepID=UPI003CF9BFB3
MAVVEMDQLGHVDVAVILFDGPDVGDGVAEALTALHEQGTVRVIDLAEVSKAADGTITVIEPSEGETGTALDSVGDDPLDLLSESDLMEIGEGLDPGQLALVVVWENAWAVQFTQAVRSSGGDVVLFDRIPREIVQAAVEALAEGDGA